MKNKTLNIRTTEKTLHLLIEIENNYLEKYGSKKSKTQIIEELIYKEYKETCKDKQMKMKI